MLNEDSGREDDLAPNMVPSPCRNILTMNVIRVGEPFR
jgi:hypothetical protein